MPVYTDGPAGNENMRGPLKHLEVALLCQDLNRSCLKCEINSNDFLSCRKEGGGDGIGSVVGDKWNHEI